MSSAPLAAPVARSRCVLIVDDEPQLLRASATYFQRSGYTVTTASNALDALALLRDGEFHAMLCDVMMPGASGLELVPRALEIDPDLAVVMLSGMDDASTARAALQSGAMDYLVKPAALGDLGAVVERALGRRDELARRRRASRGRRVELALRASEVQTEAQHLQERTIRLVESLVDVVEGKNAHLRGRSERIAALAAGMAEHLGLVESVVRDVRLAGRLHDVGMLGILESVLNNPGSLTPEEFEHVKDHVRIGMEILTPLEHLGPVLDYVQDHHERWDGTGYPRRIEGESISIGGRILAAADAFDSLTSGRSFRRAASAEDALQTISYVVGSMIEQRVYDALCAVVRDAAAVEDASE